MATWVVVGNKEVVHDADGKITSFIRIHGTGTDILVDAYVVAAGPKYGEYVSVDEAKAAIELEL